MPALTRTEAQTRARLLAIRSYAVDLDLTRGEEVFGSTTVIRFGCTAPGAATFVEVRPAALRRVVLNGADLDPATLDDGRVTLTGLAAENELRVEADMSYSRTGEGLHRFTDPADGEAYVATQCAPDEASRVFACFDQPDLKAVMEISVTAPPHWTVLSNGAGTRGEDGRWTFGPTPPISTYLAVVVGGPLHSVYTEHDGVPLGLHCRRSIKDHLDALDRFDTGDLLARLAEGGAGLLVQTLDGIEDGTLEAREQPSEGVSFAPKITVEDARVDWTEPAVAVDRRIRACTPTPGAWSTWAGERIKLGPVSIEHDRSPLPPGELEVTRNAVLVGTGTSPVRLGRVKAFGKKEMPAVDWARGVRPAPGARLGD